MWPHPSSSILVREIQFGVSHMVSWFFIFMDHESVSNIFFTHLCIKYFLKIEHKIFSVVQKIFSAVELLREQSWRRGRGRERDGDIRGVAEQRGGHGRGHQAGSDAIWRLPFQAYKYTASFSVECRGLNHKTLTIYIFFCIHINSQSPSLGQNYRKGNFCGRFIHKAGPISIDQTFIWSLI